MDRRFWLMGAAATAAAAAAPRLWAAPSGGSRFLFVFLRGGCDAASVLAPLGNGFYREARPSIAIPPPSDNPQSAMALDADWALHPALRATVGSLVQRKEAAFIPFAGTEDLSRSHFETQDSIELGQALTGHRDFRSGFMNRLAAVLRGSAPIAFTDQLPVAFEGHMPIPNIALRTTGKPAMDDRQSALVAGMYQGTPLERQVKDGFAVRGEVTLEMAQEMEAASRGAVSPHGFEAEAVRVARLMRDRFTLGFLDIGGWDTHVGQGGATGYLAGRLEELGRGLSALALEMGPLWRETTVVVMSEFGRTFRENGNGGTDHGHGGMMWLLGGATKRAPVQGEQLRISPATLLQNRDWPVLNDYRNVLATVLRRQFDLSASDLATVFPGAVLRPMDIG